MVSFLFWWKPRDWVFVFQYWIKKNFFFVIDFLLNCVSRWWLSISFDKWEYIYIYYIYTINLYIYIDINIITILYYYICNTYMIYINIRYDYLPKLIDNNIYKIQLYKTMYVLRYLYTCTNIYELICINGLFTYTFSHDSAKAIMKQSI